MMEDDQPIRTRLSRRSMMKSVAAGTSLLALGATTGTAASPDRSSYTVMGGTEDEFTVYVYDSGVSGPTTMVVGGLHGDEQSGYLAGDDIATWSVTTGKLVVIPRAHTQAIEAGTREYDGVDMNRQFPPTGGSCTHPVAEEIWDEVLTHDPDWVFDLHSSRGIYNSGDGGVGQAMFPTETTPARSYGENCVPDLNDFFDLSGDMQYVMGNTVDADRDMLVHRVTGVLDHPGFICETTEKADTVQEQVDWHKYSVEHVMNQYGHYRGTPASAPTFEANMIQVDDPVQTYAHQNYYSYPAVLSPSLSYEGSEPCHVRLDVRSGDSFDANVEEWAYQNGVHYAETAGYFVAGSGVHQDDGGRPFELGRLHVDENWERVPFDVSFGSAPVVFSNSQLVANADPVITRVQDIDSAGFDIRLHEEDAADQVITEEYCSWFAIPEGSGSLGGRSYEVGTLSLDENWKTISFDQSYTNPVFFADVDSYVGWNTAQVRWDNLSGSSVDVFIEEEQSDDTETGHDIETVGYFVMEG